jgi:plasmid stabilization system protein ParE
MRRVLFTAAARSDLIEAIAWLEAHATEIVPRFRLALRTLIDRIAENPRQFPQAPHDTRRALLRGFPYLVLFKESGGDCFVVALFHTSRDPRVWEDRTS